ncbi:MAG: peroxide stress protein YaaA [Aquificaceae bacterium]|nr:peroxide stress protein YaaA [Aquificaceae bacterium]
MLVFLLPYSKKQRLIQYKDCGGELSVPPEFEPFFRLLEKILSKNNSLSPLYRRFANSFWESLEFWSMPKKVKDYLLEHSWVMSPLHGLVKPDACVPYAPISWKEKYEGKPLLDFWRVHLKNLSLKLFKDKVVLPLIPKAYLHLFNFSTAQKIVFFEYYRRDSKVRNPAKHYAYSLRYIAERELSLQELQKINFYDYRVEKLTDNHKSLILTLRSEGKYEL